MAVVLATLMFVVGFGFGFIMGLGTMVNLIREYRDTQTHYTVERVAIGALLSWLQR